MQPERWKLVEQILEEALECAPQEREAYLERACAGDDDLKKEVGTLIHSYEEAGNFIEEPILPSPLATRHSDTYHTSTGLRPTMSGRYINAYQLVNEIGRGGMGTVYLAVRTDLPEEKRVAIKLIKRGMDTDFILRRFRRERQILASLTHPNIAELIDGGSTDDGLPYFVMEYIEGQPIHRYCDERRLTITGRLQLFVQVCAAVACAHQKQIVHRDIKPGNILVTSDGIVKLLDFGIAKLLDTEQAVDTLDPTGTAMRLMTPEYASPEQVRGIPVTPASDVYSLGVLLYELLTGRRPYKLSSRAPHELARVICEEEPTRPSSIVSKAPPDVFSKDVLRNARAAVLLTSEEISALRSTNPATLREELSGNLDNIILRALQKNAQQRYQSAAEMGDAIARHLKGENVSAPIQLMPETTTQTLADNAPTLRSIAVLPLQVMNATVGEDTGESYLGVGIADALIMQLSNINGLVVRPTSAVMKFTGEEIDPVAAGRELGVDHVLDGRIQMAATVDGPIQLRVSVQLVNTNDKSLVWAAQFNEKHTDLLSLQDAMASQVAEALVTRLTGDDRLRLTRRGTEDPRAYEAYLRGRYHWHSFTPEGLAQALVHFNDAISLDPVFAAPYAGIAEYYNRFSMFGVMPSTECFAAAREAARQAVRLDETLAEAWAALAFATLGADWDVQESKRLMKRALEINPNLMQAHEWNAYIQSVTGDTDGAVKTIERLLLTDQNSPALYALYSFHLYQAHRLEDSLHAAQRAVSIDPNSFWAIFALGMDSADMKRHNQSFAAMRRLMEMSNRHPMSIAGLGYALACAGRHEEAQVLLDKLLEISQESYASHYFIACIYLRLGEIEEVYKWLEKGIEERDVWILFCGQSMIFEVIRSEPRFQDLMAQTGLLDGTPKKVSYKRNAKEHLREIKAGVVSANTPTRKLARKPRWLWAAVAVAIIGLAAVALYQLSLNRSGRTYFRAINSVKLTTTGNAVVSTISPDGKYVAFVTEENGQQSLWVRQTAVANSKRIVAPDDVEFRGLTFTRDGENIYYVIAGHAENSNGTLYRVSVLGSGQRKIKDDIDSPIAFSPDGRHFAFVRHYADQGKDELLIASEDSSAEEKLAERKFPEHFSLASAPAWAPDNGSIAVVLETSDQRGFFMKAINIALSTKAEEPLASEKRWIYIDQVAWLPDAKGLLMAAQDSNTTSLQLWSIAGSDNARMITNDISSYKGVSLPSSFDSLVSVSRQTLINIWVLPKAGPDQLTQITTGAGRYFDLSWTPDGQVIYASDSNDSADIWIKHAVGTDQRQLTAGAGRNYGPTATLDGRYILFHSNRSGSWQIWRMNSDGSGQRLLSTDKGDSNWAQATPDGKWVIYEHVGAGTLGTLWKMPMDGGAGVRLTSEVTLRPAISPDGKWIACWRKEQKPGAPWKLALIPIEGGEPAKLFEVPQGDANGESSLRWTADGLGIAYIDYRDGKTTIWSQPISGGAPTRIFTSANEIIYSFDIARDGRIVLSRGVRADDVLLITDSAKTSKE